MAERKIAEEEFERHKKQYEMCRHKIYENAPQVRKYEKSKKRWVVFLLVYGLLLTLTKIYVFAGMLNINMPIIKTLVTSLTPILIFLLCALGSWKFALPLYILSGLYLVQWAAPFTHATVFSFHIFILVYISSFYKYPIQASLDLCSLLYGILILVTAIRLTLFRRNRALSDQSVELMSQLKESM